MAAFSSGARRGRPAMRRESPRAKRAGWAAVIGLFVLSGCSWASGWFGSSEPAARPILEPGTCPTAAILKPLSQTALFAPGQPHEPPGVAFYGLLSEVEAKCDRAAVSDHIEETIPLGGRRPGDVNVILGFQQGAEAVEFYRHYRGR